MIGGGRVQYAAFGFSKGRRIAPRSDIASLQTAGLPPTRAVPQTQLRMLGHGRRGDKLQAALLSVANAKVLKLGFQVL